MELEAGADQEDTTVTRSEESLSSQVVLQLGVVSYWGTFCHSEVTSEPDSSTKQSLQTWSCVWSYFQPATVTNKCQNLTSEIITTAIKGHLNVKLKYTGTVCLQTDFSNFKGKSSFCCFFITLRNVVVVQKRYLRAEEEKHACLKLWVSNASAK